MDVLEVVLRPLIASLAALLLDGEGRFSQRLLRKRCRAAIPSGKGVFLSVVFLDLLKAGDVIHCVFDDEQEFTLGPEIFLSQPAFFLRRHILPEVTPGAVV